MFTHKCFFATPDTGALHINEKVASRFYIFPLTMLDAFTVMAKCAACLVFLCVVLDVASASLDEDWKAYKV